MMDVVVLSHRTVKAYVNITIEGIVVNFERDAIEIPFEDHGSNELTLRAKELGDLYLSDGPTLLHGDFYPGSWLRTTQGIRIIDPEFAFTGAAEFDVGVFAAHLAFTGLDDAGLSRKCEVLGNVLDRHAGVNEPLEVLATCGGCEIAMMTGAMLEAAQSGMLLLVDGFIATSAFLVAFRKHPEVREYAVFAHQSDEQGHQRMLEFLQAEPLLNLGMRLGEGTGAAVAFPLVQSAVAFLNEMASFESTGVSDRSDGG